MKVQRIIGIVLIIGAIVAFSDKFLGGYSGHLDPVLLFFMVIVALLLVMGIGRVLRS